MAWSLTSPVTGATQTGLTSPTYTCSDDVAPDVTGKQKAVTSTGGTQTGVNIHSVSCPFTITFFRPKTLKTLGMPDPRTGQVYNVPRNVYKVLTRKGVSPLAGQPFTTAMVSTIIEVPAGSDLADAPNLRAMLSLHIGALSQQSAGLGDTAVSGIS